MEKGQTQKKEDCKKQNAHMISKTCYLHQMDLKLNHFNRVLRTKLNHNGYI